MFLFVCSFFFFCSCAYTVTGRNFLHLLGLKKENRIAHCLCQTSCSNIVVYPVCAYCWYCAGHTNTGHSWGGLGSGQVSMLPTLVEPGFFTFMVCLLRSYWCLRPPVWGWLCVDLDFYFSTVYLDLSPCLSFSVSLSFSRSLLVK